MPSGPLRSFFPMVFVGRPGAADRSRLGPGGPGHPAAGMCNQSRWPPGRPGPANSSDRRRRLRLVPCRVGPLHRAPSPGGNLPNEMVELEAGARLGDSGRPILNAQGELAGTLFGTGLGRTLGSYCGRVSAFLASTAGDFQRLPDSPVMVAQVPPPYRPPQPSARHARRAAGSCECPGCPAAEAHFLHGAAASRAADGRRRSTPCPLFVPAACPPQPTATLGGPPSRAERSRRSWPRSG